MKIAKAPPLSPSPAAEVINSLLLLYWFVPVYLVLLFFNHSVSRPPNRTNCPFIAGGPYASSDINSTKPTVRRTLLFHPSAPPGFGRVPQTARHSSVNFLLRPVEKFPVLNHIRPLYFCKWIKKLQLHNKKQQWPWPDVVIYSINMNLHTRTNAKERELYKVLLTQTRIWIITTQSNGQSIRTNNVGLQNVPFRMTLASNLVGSEKIERALQQENIHLRYPVTRLLGNFYRRSPY